MSAIAAGGEVVISRGQLVEIGGSFRIPEVMEASGATLVEVGTTNRTRLSDYADAVSARTSALMVVHQSNFRTVGFVEEAEIDDLARLAEERGIPLIDDLGSGSLGEVEGEPSIDERVRAGATVVCFSADKLLGGPQAGIVVGRADLVERLRRHPLQRALRVDKLSLAALEGTLRACLEGDVERIPVLRMLHEVAGPRRVRAERLAALVGGTVEETVGRVGGGALPLLEIPSWACVVDSTVSSDRRNGSWFVSATQRVSNPSDSSCAGTRSSG